MPAVVEFDAEGGVVQSWGDPEDPDLPLGGFQWVRDRGGAHGLYIDHKGTVWSGTHTPGASYTDAFANIATFTSDGNFLMQKERSGRARGTPTPTTLASRSG